VPKNTVTKGRATRADSVGRQLTLSTMSSHVKWPSVTMFLGTVYWSS